MASGPFRIGVHLPSLGTSVSRGIEQAWQFGAQGVELDVRTQVRLDEMTQTAVRHLRRLLEERGLAMAAVAFPTRGGYNDPHGLERRVEATRKALQLAYRLGAPVVVNQVGQIPEENQGPQWDLLVEVLTDLGRWGQRCGALLAAQTGANPPKRLKALLQALPEGSLLVDLDPGLLVLHDHSVVEAVEELGPWIAHVHARDATRDRLRGQGVETPLGRGSVDFEHLLGLLEERGYRGFLTVIGRSGASAEEIRLGVSFLKSLLPH